MLRSGPRPASATQQAAFEDFVRGTEPRLRRALVAAYGFDDGRDACAEALAYAWEQWERVSGMANPAGYLFRVAQSRSRGKKQPTLFALPPQDPMSEYRFEPGLPDALAALSQRQRLAVVLVHGFGYTAAEVAELTGLRQTTVRNHLSRGLAKLRDKLGITLEESTGSTR